MSEVRENLVYSDEHEWAFTRSKDKSYESA